jgi:F-type H+-transporting ATPase subunit b
MDTFWVALGFIIFVGLLGYFGVHKMLFKALDDRAAKVQEQLDTAAKLRKEAEALLAEYEAKRAAAERDAAQIVSDAKAEAERIRIEQEAKLTADIARRTKMAELKIAAAEANAASDVRAAAADVAIQAAESILKAQTRGKLADDMIAKGLTLVKSRLN